MGARKRIRRKIVAFVLLTFAISSISYYLMISTGSEVEVGVLWMWSPGIAAILTQLLFRDSIRDLGWRPGRLRYLLLGYATPLVYALAIYVIVWVTGLGGFQARPIVVGGLRVPFLISLLASVTLLSIPAYLAGLGEEIGWRGLLVPELAKITTFCKTALVTGIIWAVWHYPAIIFAGYHSEAPRWFDLSVFTMSVMGMSFFVAWLRLKTGSVWPAVLWHGNHNLFIQGVFLNMTTDTGPTEYLVDDFGLGILVSALILAFIFWRRRSELPDTSIYRAPAVSTKC